MDQGQVRNQENSNIQSISSVSSNFCQYQSGNSEVALKARENEPPQKSMQNQHSFPPMNFQTDNKQDNSLKINSQAIDNQNNKSMKVEVSGKIQPQKAQNVEDKSQCHKEEFQNQLSKQGSKSQSLLYYQIGDLVIVKTEDLLRPGVVIKAMKNYTVYKVKFIGINSSRNYALSQLQDYDAQGRQLLQKQIESRPQQEQKLKKVLAMADRRLKVHKQKQLLRQYNQVYLKLKEVQDDLCDKRVKQLYQQRRDQKIKNTKQFQKAIKIKARLEIQKMFLQKSQQSVYHLQSRLRILKVAPVSQCEENSNEFMMDQKKTKNEINTKTFTYTKKQKMIDQMEIQKPKVDQIPGITLEAKGPKKQENIIIKLTKNSQSVASSRLSAEILNENQQNNEFELQNFLPKSRTIQISPRKLSDKIIFRSESQKLMNIYLQEYVKASQQMSKVLIKLSNKPQAVLIRLMQLFIQQLNKRVVEGEYEGENGTFEKFQRYGQDTDILAVIFKYKLIDIHILTESKIIIKAAMCVWNCKEFYEEIKNNAHLIALYQQIRQMVEFWAKNYEEQSIKAGVNEILRLKNMQKLNHFYNLIKQ